MAQKKTAPSSNRKAGRKSKRKIDNPDYLPSGPALALQLDLAAVLGFGIPADLDLSFLAALPADIREEVIADHRQQLREAGVRKRRRRGEEEEEVSLPLHPPPALVHTTVYLSLSFLPG